MRNKTRKKGIINEKRKLGVLMDVKKIKKERKIIKHTATCLSRQLSDIFGFRLTPLIDKQGKKKTNESEAECVINLTFDLIRFSSFLNVRLTSIKRKERILLL